MNSLNAYLTWRVVAFLCFLADTIPKSSACPKSCACYVPTEVHCTFRYLTEIPGEIQPAVERINLGYNSLTLLKANDFSGLGHLELLMLHSNTIHKIEDKAFRDLQSLQVLKMSYNRVKEINKETFIGLRSLVRLQLDHNRIEFINPEAFYGLTDLQLVQLEGNLLQQLHPDTFVTMRYSQIFKVSSLKNIYLSDNALSTLPSSVFSYCTQLENVYLHGNPWLCDCRMEWFVEWAKKEAGVIKCKRDRKYASGQLCPVCQSPGALKGKNIAQLSLAALSCGKPQIFPYLKQKNFTLDEGDYSPVSPGDFIAPIGSWEMNITDQFQNDASVACTVRRPSGMENLRVVHTEEVTTLSATIGTSLVCNIDYEHIQKLWRILATYSDSPMRLERGLLLTTTPEMIYRYRQKRPDEGKDEITSDIEAEIKANPGWLMQGEVTLQLDRTTTTFTTLHIKYMSVVQLREERMPRSKDRYSWAMIKRDNLTKTEQSVLTGGVAHLNCQAYGNPKPSTEWILPDGSKVRAPYNSEDRRIVISDTGSFTLRAADSSDTGLYHCIATNYLDSDVLTFRITVLSPDIEEGDVNGVQLSSSLGDNLFLDCGSVANPEASIQWILPDHTVLERSYGNRKLYQNGTLRIQSLTERDRGFYRCLAANYMGVDLLASQIIISGDGAQKNRVLEGEGSGSELGPNSDKTEATYNNLSSSISLNGQESRTITSNRPYPRNRFSQNSISSDINRRRHPASSRRVWGTRRVFDKTPRKVDPQKWVEFMKKANKNKKTGNEGSSERKGEIIRETTERKALSSLSGDGDAGSGDSLSEDGLIIIPSTIMTTTEITEEVVSNVQSQTDAAPILFLATPVTLGSHATESNTVTPIRTTLHHTISPSVSKSYALERKTSRPPDLPITLKLEVTDSTSEMHMTFSGEPDKAMTKVVPLLMTQYPNLTTIIDKPNPRVEPVVHTSTDSNGQTTFTAVTTTEREEDEITFHTTQKIKSSRLPAGSTIISRQQIHIIPARKKPGKRRNFPKRRRIVRPNRITDFHTYLNKLKRPPMREKGNTTVPFTIELTTDCNCDATNTNKSVTLPPRKTEDGKTAVKPDIPSTALRKTKKPVSTTLEMSLPLSTTSPTDTNRITQQMPLNKVFKSTMQPQTTKPPSVAETHAFMTSADSPEPELTQDPRELERHIAYTDKPPTTTKATMKATTTTSKVIRGRIPWQKLFGNKEGQKELLNRLRKPLNPAISKESRTPIKATVTPAPTRVAVVLPTRGSLDPPITTLSTSIVRKVIQSLETSSEESGSSSITESHAVSKTVTLTTTVPPLRVTSNKAIAQTCTTSPSYTSSPSTNTKISGMIQTLVLPPTIRTVTEKTRVALSSSSGSASGSGVSGRDFLYRRKGSRRPSGRPTRKGFRWRRPGKSSSTSTPRTTMTTKKETTITSTTSASVTKKVLPTNKMPLHKPFTGAQSTIPSIGTSSGDETTTNSDEDAWKGPINNGTNIRPKFYTSTTKPRTSTTYPTTIYITATTTRPYTKSEMHTVPTASIIKTSKSTLRINTNIKLPPGKETQYLTKLPTGRKTRPTVLPYRDKMSTSQSGGKMESGKLKDREKTLTFDTLTILTAEQGFTNTPAPYSSDMENGVSNVYDLLKGFETTTSNVIDFKPFTQDMSSKPRIVGGNAASFTVLSNSDAFLPCEAVGNPEPRISWKRFSSSIGSSLIMKGKMGKFEVFKNGTLSIQNANIKDRGQYLCLAENDNGSDKLLVTLSVVAYPSRILEPKMREIKSQTGNTVEIKCKSEGRPTPLVSWILANRTQVRGSDHGRVKVTPDGTLIIQQASVYDRGHYKCIASNPAGVDTATVRLHVVAAPPGIMEEKRQHIKGEIGQILKMPCTAQGNPQPTVHWVLFDGTLIRPLQYVRPGVSVFANGTLYLRSLAASDSGKYECIATSSTGSERRVVSLTVEQNESMPRIVEASERRTELSHGERLHLNCSAIGEPKPKIIWRLPSKAIVDQWHRMGNRIHVLDNGTLIIDSVSEKDAGDYLCVARNKIGDDLQLMRVSVTMKPAKIETKLFNKKQVPFGNDLKVDCRASGAPEPEISWGLPDGTVVNSALQSDDSGGRARRYVLFDNGTLYFNKVGMTEEGDYTCYAENTLGKDEMHVHITVVTAPPRIQPSSRTYARVKPGGNVCFDCEAVGEPKPKILWMLPSNDMIAASNDRYLMHVNGSLDIRDVKLIDAGEYVCVARNSAGDDRKVYKLDIDGNAPIINSYYKNRTVVKDTAAKYSRKLIDCKAEGDPAPQITWIMPDNIFITAPYYGSRINVHPNGTLEIRNVRPTDTAEFICMARNDGGEAVMVVQLEVTSNLRRPIFKNPFNERVMTRMGKTTVLNCSADGYPMPEIIWILPNGTRFTDSLRGSRYQLGKDGTFIIYNPSEEDTGKYRCAAKNSVGYIEKLILLEVGQKPYILTQPRGIIRSVSGEPLFLHCLANGSPRPKIYWTVPNGRVLSQPQLNGRILLLENGTLVVQDTTLSDRGNYLCRAKSDAGEAILTVPVIVIAYPPRITNGSPQSVRVVAGAPVQLNCVAIGIPKPEITWELPDHSVLSTAGKGRPTGSELLHPQGTLIIQKPTSSDSGNYKCVAKNHLGTDSRATYVHVL